MNIFRQFGIRDVMNVTFYSINKIGDEEFYTPVLVLDTLKVSSLEKDADKVVAKGGKGNKKLLAWNFGKDLKLTLKDALFSPASMSLIWGGKLNSTLTDYTSAVVKTSIANKYGMLNYSIKAYPSPALNDDEWELIFRAATELEVPSGAKNANNTVYWVENYAGDTEYIEENRVMLRKRYFHRTWVSEYLQDQKSTTHPFSEADYNSVKSFTKAENQEEWFLSQPALPEIIISKVFNYINELKKLGKIETQIEDTEYVDTMQKCIVKDKYGLTVSTAEQKKNLLRMYRGDYDSSYVIYYDAKTMLPLLHVTEEGFISGWDAADTHGIFDRDFDGKTDSDKFTLKQGTVYYKWSREVKRKIGTDDGVLGKTFVIDSDTFPDTYKIVGETYIRDQKTGNDLHYQITINRAEVSSNTSLTLEAEGEPTVFDMDIEVLSPPNDVQIEMKLLEVEEDFIHGGTRVVPQKSRYTYTPTDIVQKKAVGFANDEIY